jgi:putative membrane protein insertion efficiency factor
MLPVSAASSVGSAPRRALITLIRLYQVALAPVMGPACRYEPSCSAYAMGAIERHGVVRGSWLAVRRLLRCHPFGGFGMDPVP